MTASVCAPSLLSPNDPDPVEWVREDKSSPLFLVCEHAGQAIPRALGDLGVAEGAVDGHRGWDIGAEALARALSDRLDAPLVLQRYSRLVIDCNRPFESAEAMPEVSHGMPIPANHGLGEGDRQARRAAIFAPFDAAITSGFARYPRRVALSIHSFTKSLGGRDRPWHAGFLARKDQETPRRLCDHLAGHAPDLVLAINEPYQIDDETDWFIPAHAEPQGVAHCLIEIRNDGLVVPADIERWADRLASAITSLPELQPCR